MQRTLMGVLFGLTVFAVFATPIALVGLSLVATKPPRRRIRRRRRCTRYALGDGDSIAATGQEAWYTWPEDDQGLRPPSAEQPQHQYPAACRETFEQAFDAGHADGFNERDSTVEDEVREAIDEGQQAGQDWAYENIEEEHCRRFIDDAKEEAKAEECEARGERINELAQRAHDFARAVQRKDCHGAQRELNHTHQILKLYSRNEIDDSRALSKANAGITKLRARYAKVCPAQKAIA